jgi:hypothetical protein
LQTAASKRIGRILGHRCGGDKCPTQQLVLLNLLDTTDHAKEQTWCNFRMS